jgi:hypothetical protein
MWDEAQPQRVESARKVESLNRWLSVLMGFVLAGVGGFVLFHNFANLSSLGSKKGGSGAGPQNGVQRAYQHVVEQIQRRSGEAPFEAKPVGGYEPGKPLEFPLLKEPGLGSNPPPQINFPQTSRR